MKDYIVTEYAEEINKEAQILLQPDSVLDADIPKEDGEQELTVVFRESPMEVGLPDPLVDPLEDVVEFSEELPGMEDGLEENLVIEKIPGSDADINMLKESEPEPEPEEEKTWEKDRDVSKFMAFISSAYPGGIPRHDGTSIIGAERAMNYLNNLNKQISEALKMDRDNELDAMALDKIRVNMMNNMMTLKNHIKDLQKRVREDHKKRSSIENKDMVKEGSIPIPTLVMTPFERAVAGIIINSVISAGHPFEDVYEHLKDKYALTDKEELAIMQLVMDMGYPIFKDRGTYSSDKDGYDGPEQGLDFIKNYFA